MVRRQRQSGIIVNRVTARALNYLSVAQRISGKRTTFHSLTRLQLGDNSRFLGTGGEQEWFRWRRFPGDSGSALWRTVILIKHGFEVGDRHLRDIDRQILKFRCRYTRRTLGGR